MKDSLLTLWKAETRQLSTISDLSFGKIVKVEEREDKGCDER